MYCLPGNKSVDIYNTVEQLKGRINSNFQFIVGRDFNVNLIKMILVLQWNLLMPQTMLALHPVISLPKRISNTCASLIDNFVCDFSLQPARTYIITTDYLMIELKLPICSNKTPAMRQF